MTLEEMADKIADVAQEIENYAQYGEDWPKPDQVQAWADKLWNIVEYSEANNQTEEQRNVDGPVPD